MKNGNPTASINDVINGLGEFGGDVVALAGLQARLAAEDMRESADRVRPGAVALAAAVPLAIAGVVALVLGGAYSLAASYGWPLGYTLMSVGAAALAIAAAAVYFALSRLRAGAGALRRSREELERNVQWLRTVVLHGAG